MSETQPPPSPVEVHDPLVRNTLKQASVWLGLAALLFLAWHLATALLLIIGGIVFAAFLDLGSRALARVWNGPRGVRLAIIVLTIFAVIIGFLAIAGIQLATQAGELSKTLTDQVKRLSDLLESFGIARISGNEGGGALSGIASQVIGSFGKLTQALSTAAGGIGSFLLILVIGIYIAAEPRLYERGLAWLTPMRSRSGMADLTEKMAETLRRWTLGRLIAMLFEGVFTTVALTIAGIPLAPLLGLIAAILAFIPNIGAFISGAIIILVGFSTSTEKGLIALGIYLFVQLAEGNFLTPMVERRVVDIAPAVTLAAQLLFGALFGLVGVALAVPIVAMVKVALEHQRSAGTKPRREKISAVDDLEPAAHPS